MQHDKIRPRFMFCAAGNCKECNCQISHSSNKYCLQCSITLVACFVGKQLKMVILA